MNSTKAPALDLAEVYITDELTRRPPSAADHLREKIALQELAARMADDPEKVLPRFVDLAMEIAGGVSAGISLYEPSPAPGVFRWRYLRGTLAPFNEATTPRDFSPCGITVDRNAPTLSLHPERFYDWISNANIVVPEALLVPLHFDGPVPMGTLWIVSDQEGHFDSSHTRAATELAGFVSIALRMLRSKQQLQKALEEQRTFAKEMNHRVKNLFAMTEGMIRLTGKEAADKTDMVRMLAGRMRSLARAHALASRDINRADPTATQASDLDELVKTILAPHERATAASRFAIAGPAVTCGERAINAIALALHELATNAAKYGALSHEDGRIEISWTRDSEALVLQWTEFGGPPVFSVPTANGFGGTLIRMMIDNQLAGSLDYDWRPTGLSVTIIIPLSSLDA